MEAPAPTPPSRSLAHSSMFRFFRSLLGSKGSPKSSDKLLGGQECPSQEQDAVSLIADPQGQGQRKEPWLSSLSVALPRRRPPTPMKVLRVPAQGVEVKSVLPGESQQVLGNLSEEEREEAEKEGRKEEEQDGERDEDEETAGEVSGDVGAPDRVHLTQAQEVKRGCLEGAMGPWEHSPEAFTAEEEEEHLLEGDFRLASLDMETTPWRCLLTLYKQLQKSTMAKFPFEESLPQEEEGEEEEMEEDDSSLKLCAPDTDSVPQSPLCTTSRLTDPLGFMESELKKFLVVQRAPHLWKMGDHKDQEMLTLSEMTQEEGHRAEGDGSCLPVFGECWGPEGEVLMQPVRHPLLEGRLQNPLSVVSGTEHLLLEEMEELGSWAAE
ncbi:gametogenetin-binding protein 1-like [Talpa occidentalis]|uniref:gametogenetin-binding protein 1-like n=1 Tax=Talpa occidentalis TaxID=50954 RepID=UPI00188FA536|nr:gametogenetin-binding protein 1-like [Talpa occidentalis]